MAAYPVRRILTQPNQCGRGVNLDIVASFRKDLDYVGSRRYRIVTIDWIGITSTALPGSPTLLDLPLEEPNPRERCEAGVYLVDRLKSDSLHPSLIENRSPPVRLEVSLCRQASSKAHAACMRKYFDRLTTRDLATAIPTKADGTGRVEHLESLFHPRIKRAVSWILWHE